MNWPDDYLIPGIKPFHVEEAGIIYCADCRDILPHLPQVDLVLTDPPYNYGKDYHNHNDSMDWEEYCAWLTLIFEMIANIMQDNSSIYFTCSTQMMHLCEDWEFLTFRQWLIWHRPNLVNVHAHSDWKQTWEPIYYGGKGKFKAKKGVFPDSAVFTIATPQTNFVEGRFHVCQRPVKLIKAWLNRAEGDIILDPFLGSGTTAVAAKELGRKFIGIEISEEYCKIAVKRLRQGVLDFG